MPTGVAIRDPRGQLFDAAERVLLRDGPAALTSRAVTAEAGVAKGVLHRHFADFDAFLAELALDRIAAGRRPGGRACAPRRAPAPSRATSPPRSPSCSAPAVLALIRLVIARDELRARLRAATGLAPPAPVRGHRPGRGLPRRRARPRPHRRRTPTSPTLAPTLIGAAHLLFTDADGAAAGRAPPSPGWSPRSWPGAAPASTPVTLRREHARRLRPGGTAAPTRCSSIATWRTGCTPARGEQRGKDVPVEVGAELARPSGRRSRRACPAGPPRWRARRPCRAPPGS